MIVKLIVLTYQVIEVLQQVLHHQVHQVQAQVGVEQHVEINVTEKKEPKEKYRRVTWPKGHWKKIYTKDWPFTHFETYDEDTDIVYNNQWYPKVFYFEHTWPLRDWDMGFKMVLALLVRILFMGPIMTAVWILKASFVIYGIFPIIRYFLHY